MIRQFTTLAAAAAVVVTGLLAPAPARAEPGDAAKVLFGVAALAMIAKALDNNHSQPQVVTRYPTKPAYVTPRYQPVAPRYQPAPPRQPVYQASKFDLPGSCLRNFQVNGRTVQLFGNGCMTQTYRFASSLPYACQYGFTNDRGRNHIGYEPLCLREHGYRTARF